MTDRELDIQVLLDAAEAIERAAGDGQITWLTRDGGRVAAIAPSGFIRVPFDMIGQRVREAVARVRAGRG